MIDVGGVGYEAFVPLSTFDALPRAGADCRLLVHDYVREDQHALFGFATEDERNLFRMLQDVSGVGPKTALSALSGMPVRLLKAALAEGDAKALAKLPGIGKRTAERICVELKGKIDPLIGLKENVLIGKLIPAGTGMKRYRSVTLDSEFLNDVPDSEEEFYEDEEVDYNDEEFLRENIVPGSLDDEDLVVSDQEDEQ